MDMLTGYESDSEDAADEPQTKTADTETQGQQQSGHQPCQPERQQPLLQRPQHSTSRAASEQPVQLLDPSLLLEDVNTSQQRTSATVASSNFGAGCMQGGKRAFTSVTGHSLPNPAVQVKSSKDKPAATPGRVAQAAHGMLLPPQLRGRSNVVTEDLDRLFSTRSSPGSKKGSAQ